jgi:SAM-dependent methyltransferase
MTELSGSPVLLDAPAFFGLQAADYEAQFRVAHRHAYDDLAWEYTRSRLPPTPGIVVDVGCGVGRWAGRLVALGHRVIGIEPSTEMADVAEGLGFGTNFRVVRASVDEAKLPAGSADAVLAMGSLQYAPTPSRSVARMATWLRPGGWMLILGDSLLALTLELLGAGRVEEAVERARSLTAEFRIANVAVRHWLFTADSLRQWLTEAGLVEVEVCGLLVSWSAFGRDQVTRRLAHDAETICVLDRRLAGLPPLADAGKQLLGMGRRP